MINNDCIAITEARVTYPYHKQLLIEGDIASERKETLKVKEALIFPSWKSVNYVIRDSYSCHIQTLSST